MSYPKAVFFAFFLVIFFSAFCFAIPVRVNGDYDTPEDTITAKALIFNPAAPWTPDPDIQTSQAASITVYATADYTTGYSGGTSNALNNYNIATKAFYPNAQYAFDFDPVSGDLGIRYENSSLGDTIFYETVMTVNFSSRQPMDIYLPGFTLPSNLDMYLWVASDGSTYFANITNGLGSAGAPNIYAADSITGGYDAATPEATATEPATPEPATIVLLGLGSYFLRRKR